MSTQNRIIEIGYDAYALPDSMTDADVMKLLALMPILMASRAISSRSDYLPDKDSEYGEKVLVVEPGAMKIVFQVTPCRLLSRARFNELHAAGRAEFDAAHPKPETPLQAGLPAIDEARA